jgi:hypothetical protein
VIFFFQSVIFFPSCVWLSTINTLN